MYKKHSILIKTSIVLAVLALISGCATLATKGGKQTVKVESQSSGAHCTLKNNKGQWTVKTPGAVEIQRSNSDLHVTCRKSGYRTKTVIFKSKSNPAIAGNIAMPGGLIGSGIDFANGAAFQYPKIIRVRMR